MAIALDAADMEALRHPKKAGPEPAAGAGMANNDLMQMLAQLALIGGRGGGMQGDINQLFG